MVRLKSRTPRLYVESAFGQDRRPLYVGFAFGRTVDLDQMNATDTGILCSATIEDTRPSLTNP